MDSKQILQLNRRQSIVQRIDSMKSAISATKIKDKLSRFHYFGYPSQILVDKLISKISSNTVDKSNAIAVLNDFGLEVISQLQMLGYTNLILLCTESDDKLYNIIKYMVEKEFNFNKIVRLEENMEDKFDLVIANPPYEIGNAVITETMKHCGEAVVLMPASKYKKGNLFKKISNIEFVESDSFGDAAIGDVLNIATLTDVEIDGSYESIVESNQRDTRFYKFYTNNFNRVHYAIDSYADCSSKSSDRSYIKTSSFCITWRTVQNGTHRTENCWDYKWNVAKNISRDDFKKAPYGDVITVNFIHFETDLEHKNFSDFWYRGVLSNMLIKGLNKASGTVKPALPKLDWTKSWTDEEILKDYGYTDEEIKEILK